MGRLTGAKIGANVADKIVELTAILTEDDGAEEASSVDEGEGCSSVDEVVDTSIDDT